MLFSSLPFLFGFFPAVLILVWLTERYGSTRVTLSLLVVVSLFFYAWWNPPVVILLIVSVLVNYAFGVAICRAQRRDLLALAVLFNLGLIGYFKYAGLLAETLSMLPGVAIDLGTITLPLASRSLRSSRSPIRSTSIRARFATPTSCTTACS